ncbi:MAG: YggT family protein [Dehalococcoidia bacterium]|nr:YggT family protein [Dehalococcoidia bacterium]
MTEYIKYFIEILTSVLMVAIFARVVLSWLPIGNSNHPVVAIIYQITEPILAPLRRILPRVGMLDLSPMAAIFILVIIARLVSAL